MRASRPDVVVRWGVSRGRDVTGGESSRLRFGQASVSVARRVSDVIVAVEGEIDISNARVLEERIQDWLKSNPSDLVLDCQGLRFIDSTGLSLMVRLHNRLAERGYRLVLTGLAPPMRRSFEVTHLTDVLDIRNSVP